MSKKQAPWSEIYAEPATVADERQQVNREEVEDIFRAFGVPLAPGSENRVSAFAFTGNLERGTAKLTFTVKTVKHARLSLI